MRYRGMPESQEENKCLQLDDMQQELHSKGNVLTKAWSELFSYLSKYQAELMVKEHAVEIAEKEVEIRKRQLEEVRPVKDMGSEEVTQLRNEIQAKERLLNRAQLELSASEQTVKRISSDLSNHVQMVEKSRSELSETQKELVRFRNDCERLKSELALTNEQVQVKDKLLNKLQNQLMKENAELKEQLDFSLRALELEKKAHEITKKALREKEKSDHTLSGATSRSTMDIPDFTPSLDLSVVRDDFGLSNIIPQHGSNKTPNSTSIGPNLDSFMTHPPNQCTVFPAWTPLASPLKSPPISSPISKPSISATSTAIISPNTSYNSTETFFPLTTSMSHERNSKTAIVDMSTYSEMLNTNMKSPTSVSGSVMPVLNVPSLGSMDITSAASSSGAYSDGKWTVLKVESGEEVTTIDTTEDLQVQNVASGHDVIMFAPMATVEAPLMPSPIRSGMRFHSFVEFRSALNEYEELKKVKFVICSSRTCAAASANPRKPGQQIPHEHLKYLYARYSCRHGGKIYRPLGSGKRPNQSTCKFECPACIFISADKKGENLVIKELNEEHNHVLNSGKKMKRIIRHKVTTANSE